MRCDAMSQPRADERLRQSYRVSGCGRASVSGLPMIVDFRTQAILDTRR